VGFVSFRLLESFHMTNDIIKMIRFRDTVILTLLLLFLNSLKLAFFPFVFTFPFFGFGEHPLP